MQRGKSLKDQGKSRTRRELSLPPVKVSQSLKDQGKSRTKVNIQNIKHETESQSLKDQGKSRTDIRWDFTSAWSQSLKDQGKSRTYLSVLFRSLHVAIP